jgi:MFS family permease
MFFGSLIGTTIEFFDFYIYATRFWFFNFSFGGQYQLVLLSLATFSIAFFRDPGSAVFGHYGDRSGENYVGNCFIDDGYFNSFHWFLPSYEHRNRSLYY